MYVLLKSFKLKYVYVEGIEITLIAPTSQGDNIAVTDGLKHRSFKHNESILATTFYLLWNILASTAPIIK